MFRHTRTHTPLTDPGAVDGDRHSALLRTRLPELWELNGLIDQAGELLRARTLTRVAVGAQQLPVVLIEMGSDAPDAPVLGLIGGVHGVERIGSQVVIAFLRLLLARLGWDEGLAEELRHIKLFMLPILNPGGMWYNLRSNPNGVDLMRNAPVEAQQRVPWLIGGQRLSPQLPWYRGRAGAPMEAELAALCAYVRQQVLPHPFALTLDCHSGYGSRDRLWLPYAGRTTPIDRLDAMYRLHRLFARSYRHHRFYLVEPQSHSYTTHGDAWDLLYDDARARYPEHCYLPLTLVLGSWLWVKKNPRQLLRFASLFNPVVPHRHTRILRRHLPLLEFLLAAARSYQRWLPVGAQQARHDTQAALKHWYGSR